MMPFLNWLDAKVIPLPLFLLTVAAWLLALGLLLNFIARYL